MASLVSSTNRYPRYSEIYGGIPNLPTSGSISNEVTGILNQAIPNFSGLTEGASSIIGDAMSGQVPADVQRMIRDKAATQAVASGMPGAGVGTLHGNLELRDLGLTSLGRQDQGFQDLLSMLQGFSGTVAPTVGQAQEQANASATYAAAPNPAAAAAEQERLFDKYSNPAAGTSAGVNPEAWLPWSQRGKGVTTSTTRTPAFGFGQPTTTYA